MAPAATTAVELSLEQAAARGTSAATALCWPHARPLQAFTVRREVAVRDSALAGASASVVVLFSALVVKSHFFHQVPSPNTPSSQQQVRPDDEIRGST
jgi:hypothetical protein